MRRKEMRNKYNGCCAYCGEPIKGKGETDHVNPIWRGREDDDYVIIVEDGRNMLCRIGDIRGEDTEDNKVYTCKRCNMAKSTMTVEQFRQDIQDTADKLRSKKAQYRLIEDYGVIERTGNEIVFHFEKFDNQPEVKTLVGREISEDEVYLLCRLGEWRSYNEHAQYRMEYDEYYRDDERAMRVYREKKGDDLMKVRFF
jgi:hypothetical protein